MPPPQWVTTAEAVEIASRIRMSTTQRYWRERAKAGDVEGWQPSAKKFLIRLDTLQQFLRISESEPVAS
jgi:hypothetical protein